MSDLPIRFLHASDFQLDQPPFGLTEIPDHLREVLIDSPYRAAERVFDTALSEKAAFVCLTGELLDLSEPSARGLAFLHEQFHRLSAAGIAVYWATKYPDTASQWPAAIPLPDSVHCFSSSLVDLLTYTDATGFVMRIQGRSGSTDVVAQEYTASESGQYTVAVACGQAQGQALAKRNIDYWALGGQLDRRTLYTEPHIAHYCGTPQGRSPQDLGPHGCTLVEVRRPRETRLRFIPCDVVRWQHERVMVSAAATWSDVQETLAQRVGELRSQTPTIPLLIRWTLSAADPSVDTESLGSMAGKASAWLKKQFGYQSELCWPVVVNTDSHDRIPASSYEEDTLLGDYLRAVRSMRQDHQQTALESPCLPQQLPPELAWLADLSDEEVRSDVMREAASVGAALLRGDKAI